MILERPRDNPCKHGRVRFYSSSSVTRVAFQLLTMLQVDSLERVVGNFILCLSMCLC